MRLKKNLKTNSREATNVQSGHTSSSNLLPFNLAVLQRKYHRDTDRKALTTYSYPDLLSKKLKRRLLAALPFFITVIQTPGAGYFRNFWVGMGFRLSLGRAPSTVLVAKTLLLKLTGVHYGSCWRAIPERGLRVIFNDRKSAFLHYRNSDPRGGILQEFLGGDGIQTFFRSGTKYCTSSENTFLPVVFRLDPCQLVQV